MNLEESIDPQLVSALRPRGETRQIFFPGGRTAAHGPLFATQTGVVPVSFSRYKVQPCRDGAKETAHDLGPTG